MKYLLILFSALSLFTTVKSQDVNVLLQEAKKFEIALDENSAFNKYKEILNIQPTDLYALTRCSELAGSIGGREADKNKKAEIFEASKTYAETALQVSAGDAGANAARAIIADRLSEIHTGKERMEHLRDVKKYADLSINTDLRNAKGVYILGKWNLVVSSLNSVDRTAAKLIFGGMPDGSLDKAILLMEKARSIDQFLVVNYLELAKAYVKNHQSDKAIDVLNKMIKLPNRTQDDPALKAEGKKMVAELQ